MLWMLEQNPKLQKVLLCLDHDEAGIKATGRLMDILHEKDYSAWPHLPDWKDWNETLKAHHGMDAEPAENHPQLTDAWLNLAAACAKVPVKYEVEQTKQQQKQEKSMTMTMGVM